MNCWTQLHHDVLDGQNLPGNPKSSRLSFLGRESYQRNRKINMHGTVSVCEYMNPLNENVYERWCTYQPAGRSLHMKG